MYNLRKDISFVVDYRLLIIIAYYLFILYKYKQKISLIKTFLQIFQIVFCTVVPNIYASHINKTAKCFIMHNIYFNANILYAHLISSSIKLVNLMCFVRPSSSISSSSELFIASSYLLLNICKSPI